MKKGQMNAVDLVIGSSIFLIVILTISGIQKNAYLGIEQFNQKKEAYEKTSKISEMLISNPGYPANWEAQETINSSNTLALGFVREPNIFDNEKLSAFTQIQYSQSRKILGLSKHEFNITIRNMSDKKVLYSYGSGFNHTNLAIKRFGLLNGEFIEMEVRLFFNTSTHLNT